MSKLNDMKIGCRYIVTKGSKFGEFEHGDNVQLLSDGTMFNRTAAGWMVRDDWEQGFDDVEVAIDYEHANRLIARLEAELIVLKQYHGE